MKCPKCSSNAISLIENTARAQCKTCHWRFPRVEGHDGTVQYWIGMEPCTCEKCLKAKQRESRKVEILPSTTPDTTFRLVFFELGKVVNILEVTHIVPAQVRMIEGWIISEGL